MYNKSSRHKNVTFLEYYVVRSYSFGVCNTQKLVTLSFMTHYYRLIGPSEMASLSKLFGWLIGLKWNEWHWWFNHNRNVRNKHQSLKKQVKLSLYTPRRRIRGNGDIQPLVRNFDNGWKSAPVTLPPGKVSLDTLNIGACWVLEPVWKLLRRDKSLRPGGIWTPNRHHTERAIPAPRV
jgi:hypothetical protein